MTMNPPFPQLPTAPNRAPIVDVPYVDPSPSLDYGISYESACALARREKAKRGMLGLVAYKCPAGKWTLARGRTDGVFPGMTTTREAADRWLADYIQGCLQQIGRLVTVQTDPVQMEAFAMILHNIGFDAFKTSTFLKRHNKGDFAGCASAMKWFNQATVDGVKQVMPGLVERRAFEAALYMSPAPGDDFEPMPQAVSPEPAMAKSPTGWTGSILAGGAAIAAAKDTFAPIADAVRWVRDTVAEFTGLDGSHIVIALVGAAGILIVYRRLKQRREGLA